MAEQLYPRRNKVPRDLSYRRWRVDYDLTYDGGSVEWTGYYSKLVQAKLAAFWNVRVSSWGGSAFLTDQHIPLDMP